MADNHDRDRDDRRRRDERDDERRERRLMRARRRRDSDDDREQRPASKDVSVLGIIALVKGIFALIASLIPCLGMFAIFAAGFSLILAIAAVLIARNGRHGMGLPVAATVVSGTAVAFSLMWLAVFGAMFHSAGDHAERSPPQQIPAPPPPIAPQPKRNAPPPPPKKFEEVNKVDDEKFQKQLLEDLAKDRIKEAIRNGPGLAVTAEKLETDYLTNVVAAELKYKDKVLEVTGTVVRVVHEKDKTTYTLELETGEPTKTINCDFNEQAKYPLASVERGQKVKVRGLCTGRANEFTQLKDCVVVK